MTYEETRDSLKENINILKTFTSTIGNVEEILNFLFSRIERAMEGEKLEELSSGEIEKVECTVMCLAQSVLKESISSEESEYISRYCQLLLNFLDTTTQLPNLKNSVVLIRTVLLQKRTLDESIFVFVNLLQFLNREIYDRTNESLLSDKYYKEYRKYLVNINHDDSYEGA